MGREGRAGEDARRTIADRACVRQRILEYKALEDIDYLDSGRTWAGG